MSDLYLYRKGDILMPADGAALEQIMRISEGQKVKCKVTKRRSSPHHRLFFAAIASAYSNWPENHPENFTHEDELRGWLLCKAGYCSRIKLELDNADYAAKSAEVFSFFISQAHGQRNIFFKSHKSFLVGFVPDSIAWDKMEQSEFNKLSQDVSDILMAEIQMSLETFKNQVRQAA